MADTISHARTHFDLTRVIGRGRFQRNQAFEDAIAFRRARLARPCADCDAAGPGRCDDHGRDVGLIAGYQAAIDRSSLILGPARADTAVQQPG